MRLSALWSVYEYVYVVCIVCIYDGWTCICVHACVCDVNSVCVRDGLV